VGWAEQVAENARRYQELEDRVAGLSITETSADGAIRVTVSASGQLTALELRETGTPLDLVAEEIMSCLGRAQARIPDLLGQTVFDTVGTQDPSAHLIVADARKRFCEEVADRAPADEPPDPRSDWESRPVLEDV
jgi:hypothetical protein